MNIKKNIQKSIPFKLSITAIIFIIHFSACASSAPIQSPRVQPASNTIHGMWENGQDVIYFSEGGIFIQFRNGSFIIDGSYTINPATPNQVQSIVFDFGIFDRMDSEFNIEITPNALFFENKRPNQFGSSIAVPGIYRRSSFTLQDAGNPLIGSWKSEEEIFRFYPGNSSLFGNLPSDGHGTLFRYQNEPEFAEWRYVSFSYILTDAFRAGIISIHAFDQNWTYGVVAEIPFTVNRNVLSVQYDWGTAEFIRQ